MHKKLLFSLSLLSLLSANAGFSAGPSLPMSSSVNKNIIFDGSTVADIAEIAAPSVVSLEISVKGKKAVSDIYDTVDFGGMKLYKGKPKIVSFETKAGDGSGFIISPDGYIVTNQHLLTLTLNNQKVRASKIEVILFDGKKYIAEIIGEDEDSDIAVLKIKAKNLKPIQWADSSKLRPGDFALTIGSSLGADHTVGFGIISAVSRRKPQAKVIEALTGDLEYIQTYAQINPGNSGGPLINLNGEVLGITSFIEIAPHSPGFAIPANYAKKIVSSIIADGRVKRPAVGIYLLPSSYVNNAYNNSETNDEALEGVYVKEIMEGGPSDKAGIKAGDMIVKVNGNKINNPLEFTHLIRSNPVNTNFAVELYRGKNKKSLNLISEYLQ